MPSKLDDCAREVQAKINANEMPIGSNAYAICNASLKGKDPPMDRQQYNKCMSPYIRGTGVPVEERRLRFCVGAKLCTHKAGSEADAREICLIPKPPKPEKIGGKRKKGESCEKEVLKLSKCMVGHIDMDQASNVNSIETAIINAMMACECPNGE